MRIVEPDTSLDWEWAHAFWRLKPGRTYRFAPTEEKDPVETE